MKLKFSRQNDAIVTKLEVDGEEEEFNYLIFINKLIDGEILEESEYPEDITELERREIEQMITQINDAIVEQEDNISAEIDTTLIEE